MKQPKGLILIILIICLVKTVPAQSILEIAGGIMQLLGLDVPVFDTILSDSEEDWMKQEDRQWDWWKGLYHEFCEVFDGRLRQMIERHTGFKAQGGGFEKLIDQAGNILDFVEESIYYSDYLDQTILARIRKKDQKKKLLKDSKRGKDKEEEKKTEEKESLEFRKMLLEPEAQAIIKSTRFYGQDKDTVQIDAKCEQRNEEICVLEGFINLLTQVNEDGEARIQEMLKRVKTLNEKSQNKPLVSASADGEEVTDTSDLLATMIGITQDLYVVNESIYKMVKYHREADMQKFLNLRQEKPTDDWVKK